MQAHANSNFDSGNPKAVVDGAFHKAGCNDQSAHLALPVRADRNDRAARQRSRELTLGDVTAEGLVIRETKFRNVSAGGEIPPPGLRWSATSPFASSSRPAGRICLCCALASRQRQSGPDKCSANWPNVPAFAHRKIRGARPSIHCAIRLQCVRWNRYRQTAIPAAICWRCHLPGSLQCVAHLLVPAITRNRIAQYSLTPIW